MKADDIIGRDGSTANKEVADGSFEPEVRRSWSASHVQHVELPVCGAVGNKNNLWQVSQ